MLLTQFKKIFCLSQNVNSIKIKYIPHLAAENVPYIVEQLGPVINLPVAGEDIDIFHCVFTVGKNRMPNTCPVKSKLNIFSE